MICPKPKCGGWVSPVDITKSVNRKYHDVVHKCNRCEYSELHPIVENKINNKIGVPFEKLYGTNPYEVYKEDIEKFFNDEILDRYQYYERPDGIKVAKGFIWIASHGHFEVLTVEPMDGNQFEIAVRFPHGEGKWKPVGICHKFSGYAISCKPYRLIGKDTGGH